jgi:hypothetical protein
VGPRARPGRRARGRDRDRVDGVADRPRGSEARRAADRLPAQPRGGCSPAWTIRTATFQKLLLRRFPALQRAIRSVIYYNNELLILGLVRRPRLLAGLERLALGYLKRQVPDAEIRAKLTPGYRIGCKRIIISSDFLGTFMKPNVELVTEGIREIVPDGIVTQDGRKIELDTIVFATGFDVMNPPHFRHVIGRGGRSIREVWDEDGIRAYLGTVIPGFPNHFVLLGPNTASGNNSALQPIEAQIGFAIDALRAMDARGATAVDVRRDVMERFDDEIQRRLAPTVWNSGGCHSWYVGADGRNFTIWPAFANAYKRRLARFDPAEFELTSAPVPPAGAVPAHIRLIRERRCHQRRAGQAQHESAVIGPQSEPVLDGNKP